jgi:ATP-dependent protease ClpP protease subunit
LIKTLFAALAAFFVSTYVCAAPAWQKTVSTKPVDLRQTIDGVVDRGVVDLAEQLMAESVGGKLRNVEILINSPGGGVLEGSVYISAMEVAKARGAKFTCYVPMLAASMAFSILAHCDKRYALKGALFLWHPPRVVTGNYPLTPYDAEVLARDLATISKRMSDDLRKRMPMTAANFWYHYRAETLHATPDLLALSPGWIEIVDDIDGISGLVPGNTRTVEAPSSRYAPGRIIYIWSRYH